VTATNGEAGAGFIALQILWARGLARHSAVSACTSTHWTASLLLHWAFGDFQSAFLARVVYAQESVPGNVGVIAGGLWAAGDFFATRGKGLNRLGRYPCRPTVSS